MIYDDIAAERQRQREMWGRGHEWGWGDCASSAVASAATPDDTADLLRLAILGEEAGEVARAVLDRQPAAALRAELVQVAAVCAAWVQHIDRETRLNPKGPTA